MTIFSGGGRLQQYQEGTCANCGKVVRVGENPCPYCLYEFDEAELRQIQKTADAHDKKMAPYGVLWNVLVIVAVIVVFLSNFG